MTLVSAVGYSEKSSAVILWVAVSVCVVMCNPVKYVVLRVWNAP
jgi:hypothetical protein